MAIFASTGLLPKSEFWIKSFKHWQDLYLDSLGTLLGILSRSFPGKFSESGCSISQDKGLVNFSKQNENKQIQASYEIYSSWLIWNGHRWQIYFRSFRVHFLSHSKMTSIWSWSDSMISSFKCDWSDVCISGNFSRLLSVFFNSTSPGIHAAVHNISFPRLQSYQNDFERHWTERNFWIKGLVQGSKSGKLSYRAIENYHFW